ncbi:MAG: hypothetical protein U1F24_16935 [Alphaproteobacteria bacterium]
MTEPVFSASRTKIKRARKFITELENFLAPYTELRPCKSQIFQDGQEPKIQFEWPSIGDEPGAIIGDAIHNMRTALDLMASELARHHSGTDKNVYFPFAESADEIERMIERRFKKAGAAACDLVRTYKPYTGGNVALRAVHDLDIRDKHTMVIEAQLSSEVLVSANYDIDNPLAGQCEVLVRHERFLFSADTVLSGQDIVPTLKTLVDEIERIIESFAHLISFGEAGAS